MNSSGIVFGILNVISMLRTSYTYNHQLTKDYSKFYHTTTLLLISCSNNQTLNIETMKQFHLHGMCINVLDISNDSILINFDYHKFLARLSHTPLIVINLECSRTSAFLKQISKRILFHNKRSWLMFNANLDDAFNILHHENINFDAEIVLAIPVVARRTYDLYEVFNPSYNRGGKLNITKIGSWNEHIGWNIPLNQTKIERRHDLHGITFSSVITLNNIPTHTTFMEHLNSNDLVHLNSMNRLMYRLFVLMMEKYNFTVHLHLANIWGAVDSKGYWHGAIGMMNRSEVDFCMAGLRWDNKRYGVFEQTTHAYYVQVMFIFRHPKSIDAANVFLTPFDDMVWFAIIGLAVLSAYIASQIFTVENHKRVKHSIERENINESNYSNSALMIFGFIFQQSYRGNPLLPSSRILIFSILAFSLLILQFYSSFIVGSLLTESPKNIKTVKQLLSSRLEFGIDVVPYVIDNFQIAQESSTVLLYNKIMKNPGKVLMPLQAGLDLLKEGGFAFNTDGSYAYNILKHMLSDSEICELQEISYVPKIPTGPGVPNESPLKELVKISIRRITETGILSYHSKVWYGVRPKCEKSELVVAPVDIVHFSSALYILVIGILCSVTTLVIEIIIHCWSKHKLLKH